MAQNDRAGEYTNLRYSVFAWTVTVATVTVTVTVTVAVTVFLCVSSSDFA